MGPQWAGYAVSPEKWRKSYNPQIVTLHNRLPTASSFTHRDWTLHAFTHTHLHLHTHRLELYIARQEIYHGKIGLHMRYNTMPGQNILTAVLQSLGGHVS